MNQILLCCSYCGEQFSRSHRQPFCSRSCYGKSIRCADLDLESLGNAYLEGESTTSLGLKYGVSGTTVVRWLRRHGIEIRQRSYWLSTDRNPTRGKGHTEAAKEKIRAANHRQFSEPGAREKHAELQRAAMAEGRIKKTSQVEHTVAGYLDELRVPYERWAPIRDPETGRFVACVDFLLGDKTVLEVQGDYWHANPEIYPDGPRHASQEKTVANDQRKRADLERLGFVVRYVWENDVKRVGRRSVEVMVRP